MPRLEHTMIDPKSIQVQTLFNAMSEGMVLQDAEGTIIQFNEAALQILGLTEDELLGRASIDPRWTTFTEHMEPFPGQDHPSMVALRTGKVQKSVIMAVRKRDQSLAWISINAVPIQLETEKAPSQVVCTFVDITSQREAQDQLLKKTKEQLLDKARLDIAIRAVKFGVWDWDVASGRLHWDESMASVFGVERENFPTNYDVFEKNLIEEDRARVRDKLQKVFEARTDFSFEFRIHKGPEKSVRTLRAEGLCFYDAHGSISRVVGANWDITEDLWRAEQLKRSSKMASLGEMAAGIAHEINNPLSVIKGKSQLLEARLEAVREKEVTGKKLTPDEVGLLLKEILNTTRVIDQTTEKIGAIIKGVRSFIRESESDPLIPTDLQQVCADLENISKERLRISQIKLTIESIPSQGSFLAEVRPSQIGQILVNLLNNSIDAVTNLPDKWIRIELVSQNDIHEIRVIDSGSGIDPKLTAKIFDPFFTTKALNKGTGLGLAISQNLAEANLGTLNYQEKCPNTCFVLRLPAI